MSQANEIRLLKETVKTEKEIDSEISKIKEGKEEKRYIMLWTKTFLYRNVKYNIFCAKDYNGEGDMVLTLQYTWDESVIDSLLHELGYDTGWLTGYTYTKADTLEEDINLLHKYAKAYIDFLLDEFVQEISERLRKLENVINDIQNGKYATVSENVQ